MAIILVLGNNLQLVLKLLFADPRPYWVSSQVKAFVAEGMFGIPSGHAQNTVALGGIIASRVRKRWAWMAAFALTFLAGFSRRYLGVHFVHDVLAGWLIGGLLPYLVTRFWDPAVAWLEGKSFGQQVMLAFVISIVFLAIGAWNIARLDGYSFPEEWRENALRAGPLPDPVSIEGILTAAGSLLVAATRPPVRPRNAPYVMLLA